MLLLATTRHRNWITKIRVSRKVVFHSATLVLVGLYMLFIAGVGYYVRYFGGEWGGALQLGLVFVGLVLALALALSGSLRAKLRVFLGKHFFRYRFDYREEWLKFTATLSSQAHPQEAGQNVVKGLADMLESPAGALWLLRPDDDQYRQVARWNLAATSQTVDQQAELPTFMRSTGWVVNLEEFRASPGRYRDLRLPDWLTEYPQAWLLVPLWQGKDLLGFCVAGQSAHVGGRQLGGHRSAQNSRTPGRELPGANTGQRSTAGVPQCRSSSTECRHLWSTDRKTSSPSCRSWSKTPSDCRTTPNSRPTC